ncbi:Uncharacterized protein FWK35_00035325 [Aphis craccivora]|uniref:Uncharacterized protein n=1 Tax=Aphis craccivora TaxID=307492 RepID=A0A6G0VSM6_APHCR|nr:Uncharacterized protein FWK35_00035325 [Aphis craccivora]
MCSSRTYNVHIRPVQVQQISNFLENIKCFVPFEFNRKPRSLSMFKQWKATECRLLLLYTGSVVLMNVVSIDILYSNFLTLHVAVTILCSKRLCKQPVFVQYAEDLLKHYVVTFGNLYGHQFISHNIHGLLHITEDVIHIGPLNNLSTFKFENFMQQIKKLVRKYDRPLQQIVKRLGELNNHKSKYVSCDDDYRFKFENPHESGPLIEGLLLPGYKNIVCKDYVLIANDIKNNRCILGNGSIVLIENVAFSNDKRIQMIIGKEYLKKIDLYTIPCKSTLLGIYKVSKLSRRKAWMVSDIINKGFIYCSGSPMWKVVFPILYTDTEEIQSL